MLVREQNLQLRRVVGVSMKAREQNLLLKKKLIIEKNEFS